MSIVLGLSAVICGTYFATKLHTVNIEFRTRLDEDETRLSAGILDNVKDSGEFNYKASVLFLNTDKSIAKIEKSNPYVKVTQVLRKFPNKLYVYIAERIPKYRIVDVQNDDVWVILDDEFKVLEKISNADLQTQELDKSTVEIKYISQKIEVGDFLSKPVELDRLNSILSGVYGRTKDYFAVRNIDYSNEENTFYVTMRSSVEREDGTISYEGGCVIQIEGLENLKDRALMATSVYVGDDIGDGNQMSNRDLSQKIVIIPGNDGCIVRNQG